MNDGLQTMHRRRFLIVLGSSPALLRAQVRLDEEQVWNEYLAWLAKQPQGSFLGLIDYRKKLAAQGLPEKQIEQLMAVISARVFTRKEGMRLWFNTVYSTNNGFLIDRPNAFLQQAVQRLRPGTALDVSMGQGRNTLFLARAGWDVTGFDVSDEGLAIARKNADQAGLKIKTVLAGYQDFDFGASRWDLIAMIYAFVPLRDHSFIKKVTDSLRPGGVIVFESRLQTAAHPEGDLSSLIGITVPNELLKIFGGLRILRYEEFEGTPDFGPGTAPLVRLIAHAPVAH